MSRRTDEKATEYWLRSFPVPATVQGMDGILRRLTPRCAVDDRNRLYFRADDWKGVTRVLTELVRNRRGTGTGPQGDQTARIGIRVTMPPVCRAVMKTGLNYVAMVAGADVALDAAFDELRRIVLDEGADDEVVRRCRVLGKEEQAAARRACFPSPSSDDEHRLMLDEFDGTVRFRIRLYGHIGYECVLGQAMLRTREKVGTQRASVDFADKGIRRVEEWR